MLRIVSFIGGGKIRSIKEVAAGLGVALPKKHGFLLTGHPFVFFPLCRLNLHLVPQVCVKCCVYSLEQKPGKDCWCHQVWLYCCWLHPFICRAG